MIEPIGVLDCLLDLGADSLTALNLRGRVHEQLGLEISIAIPASPLYGQGVSGPRGGVGEKLSECGDSL